MRPPVNSSDSTSPSGNLSNSSGENPPVTSCGVTLSDLLAQGEIWRDAEPRELRALFAKIVTRYAHFHAMELDSLIGSIEEPDGIVWAPIGDGCALPHPCLRLEMPNHPGLIALFLTQRPFYPPDPTPDGKPLNCLLFFVSTGPDQHLRLLAGMIRLLCQPKIRQLLESDASNARILEAFQMEI